MRTLLLADDNITVQRVIALTFAGEARSRSSPSPTDTQAMEKMAAQRPDIVLAGTTLPQISGYDLAKFMRGKAELQTVPVLLLAGAFETVDEARLAASGANGVLEKPVEPTVVINRVKELLGLKSDETPAPAGRSITPAGRSRGEESRRWRRRRAPSRRRAARRRSGNSSASSPPSRPKPRRSKTPASGSNDYLDTLDAAFDSLDQQLSGRVPSAKTTRNPSGPLGQSGGAADPRSPGRGALERQQRPRQSRVRGR